MSPQNIISASNDLPSNYFPSNLTKSFIILRTGHTECFDDPVFNALFNATFTYFQIDLLIFYVETFGNWSDQIIHLKKVINSRERITHQWLRMWFCSVACGRITPSKCVYEYHHVMLLTPENWCQMYLSRHFGNPSYEIIPLSCFLSLVIVESNELTPRSVMTNWQLDRLYSRRETGGVIGSNSDRMVCVCVCVCGRICAFHYVCTCVCVCVMV